MCIKRHLGELGLCALVALTACASEKLSSEPIDDPGSAVGPTVFAEPDSSVVSGSPDSGPRSRRSRPGPLFMVGDSVLASTDSFNTNSAEEIIGAAGWKLTIDAVKNRRTSEGRAAIEEHLDDLPDTIVIMLGHNDDPTTFESDARQMLDLVEDVDTVYWLTMVEPRYVKANRTLRRLQATYPNLQLIDWAAKIKDSWVSDDGLHLTPIGSENLTKVILTGLTAGLDR